jgi:hypothetical protein
MAAITLEIEDSVKELREYRDKATYEEILERYTRKRLILIDIIYKN